nr:multimodular transpeptidase-transglycosylase [uncultured bacterium]
MIRRLKSLRRWQKLALILGILILALGAGVYEWLFVGLPSIDQIHAGMALPSTRIYDRNGKLLYEILADSQTSGRNTPLPLSSIPKQCQQAAIATEDANFYSNPGVDPVGIVRALVINLRGGEVIAGGSTITQQVARNLLLDPEQRAERSVQRKLREMILAVQLHSAYSKDDVLALYLNQSYFGNLAYGIEAAAQAYFGKSAPDLSLSECALLAGLLQSPAAYDPLTNLKAATDRQVEVLDLMVQNGYITEAESEAAKRDVLQFAANPFPIKAPHFVMAVIKQLERDYPDQMYHDGLDVVTTVDLDWQEAAQRFAQQHLDELNHPTVAGRVPANAHDAALVAMDPYTGQILTMLGSPDYFDESIDGAVNAALAMRQPGSALKPFTYSAAFDPTRADPWTAGTVLLDVSTPFITRKLESYTPANFGLVEHGPVTIREALASSFNIPAVVTLDHIGIQPMVQLANNAGLTSLAQNTTVDLAITLGGGEVRLMDMAQAYSIFPNGGYRVEPQFLLKVTDRKADQVIYQWKQTALGSSAATTRLIDARVAYIISNILSDNSARLRGFGPNSALQIGRPAAAKTGTTTDFRDNWVMGYTPNLVVGVWVGNADNTPMVDVTGVSGAAPIWNEFMREVLNGQPELNFSEPAGIVTRQICTMSGLLATPQCPRQRTELYIDGTQPTAPDNVYQTFTVDKLTGALADNATPPNDRVQKVFAVLPQEARDWGVRNGIPQPPLGAVVKVTDKNTGLRLLAPDPYTIFQLSPMLPAETQRLRLTVGAPQGTKSVTYLMDGQAIGTVEASPWEVWWPLAQGDHDLIARATLEDGSTQTSASVPFSVTNYAPPQSHDEGN